MGGAVLKHARRTHASPSAQWVARLRNCARHPPSAPASWLGSLAFVAPRFDHSAAAQVAKLRVARGRVPCPLAEGRSFQGPFRGEEARVCVTRGGTTWAGARASSRCRDLPVVSKRVQAPKRAPECARPGAKGHHPAPSPEVRVPGAVERSGDPSPRCRAEGLGARGEPVCTRGGEGLPTQRDADGARGGARSSLGPRP